jgi:hypothetical protein
MGLAASALGLAAKEPKVLAPLHAIDQEPEREGFVRAIAMLAYLPSPPSQPNEPHYHRIALLMMIEG